MPSKCHHHEVNTKLSQTHLLFLILLILCDIGASPPLYYLIYMILMNADGCPVICSTWREQGKM